MGHCLQSWKRPSVLFASLSFTKPDMVVELVFTNSGKNKTPPAQDQYMGNLQVGWGDMSPTLFPRVDIVPTSF